MSISDEIIKILDVLAEKFGIAVDWTSENVIPYLEQLCNKYIDYEVATSVVWIIFGVTLLILGIYGIGLAKKFNEKYDKFKHTNPYNEYDVAAVITSVGVGVAFFVGTIIILVQCFDIVTCLTFPEKIILEELKDLIQNN